MVLNVAQELVLSSSEFLSGELVVAIEPDQLLPILRLWLEDGIDLHLATIVGQDEEDRIDLYYYFMERSTFERLVLKVSLDRDQPRIESIDADINAVFYEGELTEMLGVEFIGQDVKEVFLPETWDKGSPLRKDWEDPDK